MIVKIDREYIMEPSAFGSAPRLTGYSTLKVDNDIQAFGRVLDIRADVRGTNEAIDSLARLLYQWWKDQENA